MFPFMAPTPAFAGGVFITQILLYGLPGSLNVVLNKRVNIQLRKGIGLSQESSTRTINNNMKI
jgi:hypothetical protein